MYELGAIVTVTYDGEQHLGEVVRVRPTPWATLYDVSLEREVRKAMLEDELRPASIQEVQAMLSLHGALPEFMGAEDHKATGTQAERNALLQQEHVAWLAQSLARLTGSSDAPAPAHRMRFAMDETVALVDNDSWSLGVVKGVRLHNEEPWYTVVVIDEVQEVPKEQLMPLRNASSPHSPFDLGQRARMLAPGCEQDDAYAGTICRIDLSSAEPSYDLLFDDGDVFECLGADDLAAC